MDHFRKENERVLEQELDNRYEVVDQASMEVVGKKDVNNKVEKEGIILNEFQSYLIPESSNSAGSFLDSMLSYAYVDPGRIQNHNEQTSMDQKHFLSILTLKKRGISD